MINPSSPISLVNFTWAILAQQQRILSVLLYPFHPYSWIYSDHHQRSRYPAWCLPSTLILVAHLKLPTSSPEVLHTLFKSHSTKNEILNPKTCWLWCPVHLKLASHASLLVIWKTVWSKNHLSSPCHFHAVVVTSFIVGSKMIPDRRLHIVIAGPSKVCLSLRNIKKTGVVGIALWVCFFFFLPVIGGRRNNLTLTFDLP